MPEEQVKYGENVILSGFNLEPVEMASVRKVIEIGFRKIQELAGKVRLRITLETTKHEKTFLHELYGHAETNLGIFTAEKKDYNIYKALDIVMDKIVQEVRHSRKKFER